jgi:hypothetical protein
VKGVKGREGEGEGEAEAWVISETIQVKSIQVRSSQGEGGGLLVADEGRDELACSLGLVLLRAAMRHRQREGVVLDGHLTRRPQFGQVRSRHMSRHVTSRQGRVHAWSVTWRSDVLRRRPFVKSRSRAKPVKSSHLLRRGELLLQPLET